MATFGNTTPSAAREQAFLPGYVYGQQFACSGSGTLQSISFYCSYEANSAATISFAIYTTDATPALVDYTGAVTAGAAMGWITQNVVLGATVSAATYWIVADVTAGWSTMPVADDNDSLHIYTYQTLALGSWPSTLASFTSEISGVGISCCYATYATGGGGINVPLTGVCG